MGLYQMNRVTQICWSVVAVSCLLTGNSFADDFNDFAFTPRAGLYVAGTAGYAFDYDIRSNDLTGSSDEASFDLDDDVAFTGAIGTYLGQTRVEFEVGYRDPEALRSNPPSLGETVTGNLEYLTFMGNVFYDIPLEIKGLDWYFGGGVGVAVVIGDIDFDPPTTVSDGFQTATTDIFDDINQTLAYQFMTGLSYRVAENVTLTGGYRFRGFTEFSDENSLLIFREHDVHAIEVGLRYDF